MLWCLEQVPKKNISKKWWLFMVVYPMGFESVKHHQTETNPSHRALCLTRKQQTSMPWYLPWMVSGTIFGITVMVTRWFIYIHIILYILKYRDPITFKKACFFDNIILLTKFLQNSPVIYQVQNPCVFLTNETVNFLCFSRGFRRNFRCPPMVWKKNSGASKPPERSGRELRRMILAAT